MPLGRLHLHHQGACFDAVMIHMHAEPTENGLARYLLIEDTLGVWHFDAWIWLPVLLVLGILRLPTHVVINRFDRCRYTPCLRVVIYAIVPLYEADCNPFRTRPYRDKEREKDGNPFGGTRNLLYFCAANRRSSPGNGVGLLPE